MKVVYQTCCGVDVHKSFLVATIIKTASGIEPSYQKKRFSTFNNSILQFKDWLMKNQCRDVCMESTGKYWIPVFNLLEDEINVTIANPKWVKAVKGNKDDTKDSRWIGDLFRLGLVPGSYIPCKPIRILREFTRYRYKLTSCRTSEKNRYQNALTVCNVALDSVVSDIFGKSATSVIDYLIAQSTGSINHEEIASRLLRSLKKKSDSVIESIEGYQMTDSQKYRMRLVRAHLDYITSTINDIDTMLDSLVAPYENAVQLLCTIPGVDRNSAVTVISEIGTDMTPFSNSKRLCCWAGLTPGNNEDVYKRQEGTMTRGVIVRHLVLPGSVKNSLEVVRYLYETYGDRIFMSILNQYTPMPQVNGHPKLRRALTAREYDKVVDFAISLGVERCFIQEGKTALESFIPNFGGEGV